MYGDDSRTYKESSGIRGRSVSFGFEEFPRFKDLKFTAIALVNQAIVRTQNFFDNIQDYFEKLVVANNKSAALERIYAMVEMRKLLVSDRREFY